MIETIKKQSINYLQVVPFSDFYNWSVQYLLENTHSYNEKYELVKIGSFLKRNKTSIDIQDNESYKRVTIKINNGGVFLRDVEKGLNIGTKKQFLISKGQFLLSKIDARNGAFGVVPNEVDGAIITGNFWTFDVDYNKINPYFLSLIVTTPTFLKFSENASNGTTNRHYLQESLFLEQKIPLPTIEEQNKIVAAYQEKIQLAEQQAKQANELEAEIERYLMEELGVEFKIRENEKGNIFKIIQFSNVERWAVDYLDKFSKMSFLFKGNYKPVKLKEVINSYQYGLSEKANIKNIGIPMLRMNNISNSELDLQKLKYIKKDNSIEKFILKKGDLLFNRTNSKELVGKTAIFNSNEEYTFASYLIRVVINEKLANNNYINYLFNSSILQIQKDMVSRQITGQANINAQEMQDFLFPLPPLDKQTEIANQINLIKSEIKKLNYRSEQNRIKAIKEFENEIFS